MQKVFGIIPARYASTRFPGKPLALLGGCSMVERVYRRACEAFSTVVVATDDERIADEVRRFGGQVVMTSPLHASGTDRCAEALRHVQDLLGCKADVVVNIQGDEPFVKPDLLRRLADAFAEPQTQIATVIGSLHDAEQLINANCVKVVISTSGRALYFSRSAIPFVRGCTQSEWTQRHHFYRHLGLYAYRAEVLEALTVLPSSSLEQAESLEQNRWLENDFVIRTIHTEHESISIDTPADMERAQQWLSQNPQY